MDTVVYYAAICLWSVPLIIIGCVGSVYFFVHDFAFGGLRLFMTIIRAFMPSRILDPDQIIPGWVWIRRPELLPSYFVNKALAQVFVPMELQDVDQIFSEWFSLMYGQLRPICRVLIDGAQQSTCAMVQKAYPDSTRVVSLCESARQFEVAVRQPAFLFWVYHGGLMLLGVFMIYQFIVTTRMVTRSVIRKYQASAS